MRHEVVISRRRFCFLGAAAGITLATAPLLDFLPGPVPGTWGAIERATDPFWASTQQIDAIFKEIYGPAIAAQLRNQTTLMELL